MVNKWKNQNFFQAFKNAINGIMYTGKTQRNIKIQLIFAILVIILGFFLHISLIEWIILIITMFSVLVAELFNTAIETVVDLYTEEYNEKAKIAKDVASGAVLLMAVCSVIVGILLLGVKIIKLIF